MDEEKMNKEELDDDPFFTPERILRYYNPSITDEEIEASKKRVAKILEAIERTKERSQESLFPEMDD